MKNATPHAGERTIHGTKRSTLEKAANFRESGQLSTEEEITQRARGRQGRRAAGRPGARGYFQEGWYCEGSEQSDQLSREGGMLFIFLSIYLSISTYIMHMSYKYNYYIYIYVIYVHIYIYIYI